MSTTHSTEGIFTSVATRCFLAIATCVVIYCWMFVDFSPLARMKITVEEEGTETVKGTLEGIESVAIIDGHNDPAPANVEELSSGDTEEYINRYKKVAMDEMEKFGIPASISLAQGIIESRAGSSLLAQKCKNHFGIKCWSKKHKGCCMKFKDDNNNDSFRFFEKTAWESWRAHSKLLSSGRYKKLHRHGRDYRAWAYGLKAVGYATDRTYAEKLIGVIERYDLHQYDR